MKVSLGQAIRKIAPLLTAVAVVTSLAGCDSSAFEEKHCEFSNQASASVTPVQVTAVLAPTSNFVDFQTMIKAAEAGVKDDLGSNLPDEQLDQSIGRELSVVVADGVPQLAVRRSVKPLGDSAYDRRSAIDSTFGTFSLVARCSAGELKLANDQIATQPESDLLAALSIAADQLTSDEAEKRIYILGNGIQTAGAIKMQDVGQFPKSEKYAIQLAEGLEGIGALPDLHGAKVSWYGLGQVDGTVQTLNQKARDALVFFWQQIIQRSNGTLAVEDIQSQVGSGTPAPQSIEVTPVSVVTCGLVVKLYESDGVNFKPDSNKFVDLAKAKKAATDVVKQFKSAGCEEMTVHGYAAAGVDKDDYLSKQDQIDKTNKSLTLSRAKAFAALLKSAGFKGDISTEGLGTCGTEWRTDGTASEDLQLLCRRVEVSN